MTKEEFIRLKKGDIVRNKVSGNTWLVMDHVGPAILIVASLLTEDYESWDLVQREDPKGLRVDLAIKDEFVNQLIKDAVQELKAEWDKRYGNRGPQYDH